MNEAGLSFLPWGHKDVNPDSNKTMGFDEVKLSLSSMHRDEDMDFFPSRNFIF